VDAAALNVVAECCAGGQFLASMHAMEPAMFGCHANRQFINTILRNRETTK
jgi:hypothetical protein